MHLAPILRRSGFCGTHAALGVCLQEFASLRKVTVKTRPAVGPVCGPCARCSFVGADLNPLDGQTLAMDLDNDPLPAGEFDIIVLMGVSESLHNLPEVAEKLRAGAPSLLVSYCSIPGDRASDAVVAARRERGWVNDLTVPEFRNLFSAAPFKLALEEPYKTPGPFWDQRIYRFDR